jgi:hypothetical protein
MKLTDRLMRYRCTAMEARTLWYVENGYHGRPSQYDLKAIRRDPPSDKLAMLRGLLADR